MLFFAFFWLVTCFRFSNEVTISFTCSTALYLQNNYWQLKF
jgi:hypothetical protein